jgi:hypothetical protein
MLAKEMYAWDSQVAECTNGQKKTLHIWNYLSMRKCREKVQKLFEGNSGLGTEKTSNECQDST